MARFNNHKQFFIWRVFTWWSHQYTFSHGSMKKRTTDITSSCSPTSWKCHQQKDSQCDHCGGAIRNIVLVHCFLGAVLNTQSTLNLSCSFPLLYPSTVQCIVDVFLRTVLTWNFVIHIKVLHWPNFSFYSVNDFLLSELSFDVIQARFDKFQLFSDLFSIFVSRYWNISVDSGNRTYTYSTFWKFRNRLFLRFCFLQWPQCRFPTSGPVWTKQ